jgi:hypothetical protein
MNYRMVLAMLAGVGVGGLAVQGIHAQTKPPAYYIVEIDAKNEDVFNKEWAPKADQTIKDAGGTYLVRSTTVEYIEGAAPKRILISKWDSCPEWSGDPSRPIQNLPGGSLRPRRCNTSSGLSASSDIGV